jgi:mono/diheme cytochrome c family protein
MQLPQRSFWNAAWLSFVVITGLFAAQNSSGAKADFSTLTNLVFDADTKMYNAKLDEASAPFKFNITNTWTNEITIDRVQTSCGCTVASLPANPWHIPAGGHGVVDATINLDGKAPGLIKKTITFFVSVDSAFIGTRVVTVKANIPAPPAPSPLSATDRKAAMEKAKADPQQIFTNPKCAECHVNQGRDLLGARLYTADCGICHDSPNRESSVPDLHALKVPTNLDYWKAIVTFGKPNTMMPAFANVRGGPLSVDQVHSLVEYLGRNFTGQPSPAKASDK